MNKTLPDPRVIESMAMRYRHDFGLLSEEEKHSIRVTMTQLWEEAFLRNGDTVLCPENNIATAQKALWDRYCLNVGKHEIANLSVRDAFMMGCWMAYAYWRYRSDSGAGS